MRFKRAGVRYSESPEPTTPYQAAGQLWDERIGSARIQARNWRLMSFGCLALAIGMAGGLLWQAGHSTVTPYVVEVDQLGQVKAIGPAIEAYRPTDAQIAHSLARFIQNVRALPTDPIVVRQNWLEAYDFTTDRGGTALNDYARANDPFSKVGKSSVAVEVTSVVRASESSFQIRWIERQPTRRHRSLDRHPHHHSATTAHRRPAAQKPTRHFCQRHQLEPRTRPRRVVRK